MATQIDAMDKLIKILQADSSLHDSSVQWVSQPPRQSIFSDFPSNCHPALVNSLIRNGITQLYLHQQVSWDAIEQGKNIVITTGTASGKSLCYQMPILNTALNSSSATMLFLFPTKALAQDQLQSLQKYISPIEIAAQNDLDIPTLIPGIYDGDTPASQRHMVRNKTRLLISNPDMMNVAMLPHHTLWEKFFSNLRFIVLDEIHIYRGVFGAHLVNLLRRLKRICAFYGTKPQFIMTSATIANPEEHAKDIN